MQIPSFLFLFLFFFFFFFCYHWFQISLRCISDSTFRMKNYHNCAPSSRWHTSSCRNLNSSFYSHSRSDGDQFTTTVRFRRGTMAGCMRECRFEECSKALIICKIMWLPLCILYPCCNDWSTPPSYLIRVPLTDYLLVNFWDYAWSSSTGLLYIETQVWLCSVAYIPVECLTISRLNENELGFDAISFKQDEWDPQSILIMHMVSCGMLLEHLPFDCSWGMGSLHCPVRKWNSLCSWL